VPRSWADSTTACTIRADRRFAGCGCPSSRRVAGERTMRCWVCSLSHRMESSCHRALGEPDLSCSGLEGDKKMRRTSRVNAHLHHSPSRPAGPRPSRDSCALAQAQAPWPGHDRARARKEGTEEIPSGAGVLVEYRSRRCPSLPDRKGAAALTVHWSYPGRDCPSFRAPYFGGFPGGYSCG